MGVILSVFGNCVWSSSVGGTCNVPSNVLTKKSALCAFVSVVTFVFVTATTIPCVLIPTSESPHYPPMVHSDRIFFGQKDRVRGWGKLTEAKADNSAHAAKKKNQCCLQYADWVPNFM